MTDSNSAAMLGQAKGVNTNLSALIALFRGLFPLSAFSGTFTMPAAATKTVTDANCKVSSKIVLQASNAAAGTLEDRRSISTQQPERDRLLWRQQAEGMRPGPKTI